MTRVRWMQAGQWLVLAALVVAAGLLASQAGLWLQQRSQQQTVAAALPALSDEVRQLLGNAQQGLILGHGADLLAGEQLKLFLQELQMAFPFISELELRDTEGRLLKATHPQTEASALLEPGRAALHETAMNTASASFSSVYVKKTRLGSDTVADLFVPAKKNERQSILATVSIPALLRQAKEVAGPRALQGLEPFIQEIASAPARARPQQELNDYRLRFEHQGLSFTLAAAVAADAQTRLMQGMRWLAGLLGAAAALLLILGAQAAQMRRQSRARYAQLEHKVNADARVAALGEMSTAISHELNHPLGAISNYAYSLEKMAREQKLDPVFLDGIAQIRLEASRGAEVIKSVRNFLRRSQAQDEFIDVHELLDEMRPLLQIQAQSMNCRLDIASDRQLRVKCPKTLLQQAVLNLSRNALEAMQDVPRAKRLLQIRAHQDPGSGRVTLSVLDTGPGLGQEAQKSLFKPFFTTKQDGLGIGLSLCQSIAERHNGMLRWKNNLHGGACFELDFPAEAGQRSVA